MRSSSVTTTDREAVEERRARSIPRAIREHGPTLVRAAIPFVVNLFKIACELDRRSATSRTIPDTATTSPKTTVSVEEPDFHGLSESTLINLAKDVGRGVDAKIIGNSVDFAYKSRSGKTTNIAHFTIDSAGKMVIVDPYFANASRFFADKLESALKAQS